MTKEIEELRIACQALLNSARGEDDGKTTVATAALDDVRDRLANLNLAEARAARKAKP